MISPTQTTGEHFRTAMSLVLAQERLDFATSNVILDTADSTSLLFTLVGLVRGFVADLAEEAGVSVEEMLINLIHNSVAVDAEEGTQ